MRKLLAFSFVCLFATTPVVAADLYVDGTNGADTNTGAVDSPFKTPEKGLLQAKPNDSVILRAGRYETAREGSTYLRIEKAGKITLKAFPGEKVVLWSDSKWNQSVVFVRGANTDATLEGLEITGGGLYGVNTYRPGARITLRRCEIHHTRDDCVKIVPDTYATIENCYIHHSGLGGSPDEGIDVVGSHNLVIRGCVIEDVTGSGLYFKGGSRDALVEGNIIRRCGSDGIGVGFTDTDRVADWYDPADNPGWNETLRAVVRNNQIDSTSYAGIGIYGSKDAQVYGNYITNAAQKGKGGILIGPSRARELDKSAPTVNLLFAGNVIGTSALANRPALDVRDGAFDNGAAVRFGENVWVGGKNLDLQAGWHKALTETGSKVEAAIPPVPDKPMTAPPFILTSGVIVQPGPVPPPIPAIKFTGKIVYEYKDGILMGVTQTK